MSAEVFAGTHQDGSRFICLKTDAKASAGGLSAPLLQESVPEDATCRVCQSGSGQLIKPCWCAGSVEWICRSCLQEWRGYSNKGIRCDLCGFAFLYEYETLTETEKLKLGVERSARPSILLSGCVGFAILYNMPSFGLDSSHILILSSFMVIAEGLRDCAVNGIYHAIVCSKLLTGIVLYPLLLPWPGDWPKLFPIFVLSWLAYDALVDLYVSLVDPCLGSLGYSFQRMRAGSNFHRMESWELHKIEWARGDMHPTEKIDAQWKPIEINLLDRLVLLTGHLANWQFEALWVGIGMIFACVICVVIIGSFFWAPKLLEFILSDACQEVLRELMAIGGAYLFAAVSLHWLSVMTVPPIRLVMDENGKPRVRSLQEHEVQLRPLSKAVKAASDNESV